MKVLFVARSRNGRYAPFIMEQIAAIERQGIECDIIPVSQKGIKGYLKTLPELRRKIREWHPDLIHAHYGLCGLLANLQRKIPVVTTYHGSDINNPKVFLLSRIAIRLSSFNVFVSQRIIDKASPKKHFALVPCGIDLNDYPFIDKGEARERMGLDMNRKYVLFSSAFDITVKNAPLAKAAMSLVPDAELLELKGFSRMQVATLMQAVDSLLMTSFTEGSPQVIKEAMACGCPVVSVDVGDVREITGGVEGCFIADREMESIASAIKMAILFGHKTSGRDRIIEKGFTNDLVAKRIIDIYQSL